MTMDTTQPNPYSETPTTGAQQCQFCGIWLDSLSYYVDGKRMCRNCYCQFIQLKENNKKGINVDHKEQK